MAKIRAEEIDNYGKNLDAEFAESSLLRISSVVGIDSGCSIDMIDRNLDIIKKMEMARKEMYFQNIQNDKARGGGKS